MSVTSYGGWALAAATLCAAPAAAQVPASWRQVPVRARIGDRVTEIRAAGARYIIPLTFLINAYQIDSVRFLASSRSATDSGLFVERPLRDRVP